MSRRIFYLGALIIEFFFGRFSDRRKSIKDIKQSIYSLHITNWQLRRELSSCNQGGKS